MKYFGLILLLISTLLCKDKLYVDKISFNNNFNLSDKELHATLKLQSPRLFMRSKFTHKLYNYDLQNLIGYYKTKGFIDVKITSDYNRLSGQYVQ
ncbi:uncharacterized protein METZ01_LOCUS429732, partial [marine metagenome]